MAQLVIFRLTGRCAQGHQLASILFRAGPQEPIKKGQKLEIHPMLDLVDCVGTHSGNPDKATLYLRNTVDIEQVTGENVFELMNQDTGDNAYDYAAVDDFATRPACTKLHIQMASAKVGTLRCKTGITVRQIVRKTIPFWLREFDDCFEGHAWWNGWIGAIGQEDGSVLLKAGMFDS